jgi:hypothetical protein
LEKIALLAEWSLTQLENQEKQLIEEARDIIMKMLKMIQDDLPKGGKCLILKCTTPDGKIREIELQEGKVVVKDTIGNEMKIYTPTIEEFLQSKDFSVEMAKSILSYLSQKSKNT